MGFGALSEEFSYIPRDVPGKPPTAPRNIDASTNRLKLFIEYDTVKEDGGAPITDYNIYIDDGLDGQFTGPIKNGASLRAWDSTGLTLVTGRYYRLKYSSTNIHGESELSDEVSILLADEPSKPQNIARIDMESVTAGDIRIKWSLPADEGGDPVLGYLLYLDGSLVLDASTQSTLNEYTYTGLSVGRTYRLSVTAVNDIGESPAAYLDLIAASVP